MPRNLLFIPILQATALLGCTLLDYPAGASVSEIPSGDEAKMSTSMWLWQDLTRAILEDDSQVVVELFTPQDQDPERYQPDLSQLTELQSMSLIILNGAHFETGMTTVSLPLSKVFHTASHLKKSWLSYPDHTVEAHRHGKGEKHTHRGVDGHTWMDPVLLKKQLSALARRLRQKNVPVDLDKVTLLYHQIDHLDQLWRKIASQLNSKQILSNHQSYRYLAHRYHLNIASVDLSPNTSPSSLNLKSLTHMLEHQGKDSQQTIMLWETDPSPDLVNMLRQIGIRSITIHTLEHDPHKGQSALSLYQQEVGVLLDTVGYP